MNKKVNGNKNFSSWTPQHKPESAGWGIVIALILMVIACLAGGSMIAYTIKRHKDLKESIDEDTVSYNGTDTVILRYAAEKAYRYDSTIAFDTIHFDHLKKGEVTISDAGWISVPTKVPPRRKPK